MMRAWARTPLWVCLSVCGQCVQAGNQALTAGLYGGTLGAGGATAAERSAFGQNPAAVRPGRAGLDFHAHHPFAMEEIRVAEAGGFWDFRRMGWGVGWRQTGVEDLYREDAWEWRQSLRLDPGRDGFPAGAWEVGGAWCRWRAVSPGRESVWWSQAYGLTWQMLPRIKLGGFLSGLSLLIPETPRSGILMQCGLEASDGKPPGKGRTAAFRQVLRLDFRKTGETPWRTLAGLSVSPHPAAEISAGLSTPPFQFSLGCKVAWAGLDLHQSLRYHRYLGRTLLSSFSYSGAHAYAGNER
jgi:hypothetical protein